MHEVVRTSKCRAYLFQGNENFQPLKIFKFLANKNVILVTWTSLVLQIKLDHEIMKYLFRCSSVYIDSVRHLAQGRYST